MRLAVGREETDRRWPIYSTHTLQHNAKFTSDSLNLKFNYVTTELCSKKRKKAFLLLRVRAMMKSSEKKTVLSSVHLLYLNCYGLSYFSQSWLLLICYYAGLLGSQLFFFMLTFQLCSFSSVCKLPFLFLWSSKMLPCQMISYKSARQQEVVNLSPQCTLLGKSFRVWLLQQTLSLWSVSVSIL